MTGIDIGECVMLGWNAAKKLGCENNAYENVRLEGRGHDWLIFRDMKGRAHAIDFESQPDLVKYLTNINN